MSFSSKLATASSLALGAALVAGSFAQAARTQPTSGSGPVVTTFDASDPATCRIRTGSFFVFYEVNDSTIPNFFDRFQPAIGDTTGNVQALRPQSGVSRSGNPFNFTIDLPASGTYSGPFVVGVLDTGTNSSNTFKASSYRIPLNDMFAAGGACETIAAQVIPNDPPTAEAGPDQTVSADFSGSGSVGVTLDASGSSDPNPFDTTLNYSWAQISGPSLSLAPSSSATDAMPVYLQPAQAATTVFEVTVTDSRGATSTDQVTVTWIANVGLTAEAGPNQTLRTVFDGTGTATVTLDGSASTDPDNAASQLSYSWTQVSGPTLTLAAGSSATDVMPVYEQPSQAATTVFSLTVTDPSGASSTDTVEVIWREPNVAPVADAGPPLTVSVSNRTGVFTIDGTDSSDPDGDPLTYRWEIVGTDRNGVSIAPGTSPTDPVLSLTFDFGYRNTGTLLDTGNFTARLIVNDGQLDSVADTVDVTVNRQNLPPVIDFAGSSPARNSTTTFTGQPINVVLRADQSSDPENETLRYQWGQITGQDIIDRNAANTSDILQLDFLGFLVAQPTDLQFRLELSDGTNTVRDEYDLTITPQDPVSQLRVVDAAAGSRFVNDTSGCYVETSVDVVGWKADVRTQFRDEFSYTVRTDGGDVLQSSVRALTLVGVEESYALNTTIPTSGSAFNNLQPFSNLIFEVTDTGQESFSTRAYSKIIPITDLPSNGACGQLRANKDAMNGNTVPVANAGPDITVQAAAGDVITIDGSGSSDADNDALTYRWRQLSGPGQNSVSGLTSTTLTINWQPSFNFGGQADSEVATFALVVNDGTIDSEVDIVSVTVQRPNSGPVAEAGPNQSLRNVDASTVVTLDGSASTDPDNDPLTYQWSQVSGTPVTLSSTTVA